MKILFSAIGDIISILGKYKVHKYVLIINQIIFHIFLASSNFEEMIKLTYYILLFMKKGNIYIFHLLMQSRLIKMIINTNKLYLQKL